MTYIPKLAGVGKALPEKVVTSEEMEAMMGFDELGIRKGMAKILLLLGAGELGGVLITRVPGHHRAQSGRPPARRPVPNRSLAPVNHLDNNTHVNTARSVKNSLGLQSHQNKQVTALWYFLCCI